MTPFQQAVTAVLARLEPGHVVTYGEVAAEAGFPGAARAVGTLLRHSGGEFAWWRIVRSDGRLLAGHEAEQARRLAAEGVLLHPQRRQPVRPQRSRRAAASASRSAIRE